MKHSIITKTIAATLVLLPLAACGSPAADKTDAGQIAPDSAAIADQIKATAFSIITAFNAKDAEKAVSFNASDFIQMFHGQPNADNPTNLANARKQLTDPAAKLTVSSEKVDVSEAGDMAVYTSRYVYDFTDPASGTVTTEHGNWVMIFRRQTDGTMKIYREIISDTPPA